MRVFAILQEPATYTVDRNREVYDPLGVRYAYINGGSLAGTDSDKQGIELLPTGAFQRIVFLKNVLNENDTVIMNGYNGSVFIMLFMLNIFYRRAIGIDSDTQLVIPSNPLKRLIKYLYLRTIFGNRHVYGLAGGSASHSELFSHYGMAPERIFLMPMMVDNSKFYNNHSKNEEQFTFLYVGRVVECKNLTVLMDAFVQAFSGNESVCLEVVGDGDLLQDFRAKYSEPNIRFAGKCYSQSLLDKYFSSDVFVLPSAFEPWGLVVNEALSAGLPVIASDQVGARFDLVEGRDTGFVFKWDDVQDLKEKMLILASDKELYRRQSQNAVGLMKGYWNYDLYTECLKKFIEYVKTENHN